MSATTSTSSSSRTCTSTTWAGTPISRQRRSSHAPGTSSIATRSPSRSPRRVVRTSARCVDPARRPVRDGRAHVRARAGRERVRLRRVTTPVTWGLRLSSEGEEAVLIADIAVHPALLAHPDWVYVADGDPAVCAETRRAVLPELVDRDVLVACGHYPGSGIGRVVTRDGLVCGRKRRDLAARRREARSRSRAHGRAGARRARRARARQRPLPDELLGHEGLRRVRLPARRRPGAHLRRGVRGGCRGHGLDERCPARSRATTRDDPRPPTARTLDAREGGGRRVRHGRPRALARDAGLGPDGGGADDVHARLVRGVRRDRRGRDAAPRRGSRGQDGAGDRADAPRERHRGGGDGALQARDRAGHERGADRRRVARLRARRGNGLGGKGRPRARLLARLGGTGNQDLHRDDERAGRRGRADALRDLGLRGRLLVRSHEESRGRRAHTCVPGARGRSARGLCRRARLRCGRARASPSSIAASAPGSGSSAYPGQPTHRDLPRCRRARARASMGAPGRRRGDPRGDGSCNRARVLYGRRRWPSRRGQLPDHGDGAEKLSPFPDGIVQAADASRELAS